MNRLRYCLFATTVVCMFSSSTALSQVVTGTPAFGTFAGGPFDIINLSNLNVHSSILIMNKAGAGLPFTYAVTYDSSIWYPVGSSGNQAWSAVTGWGWNGISDGFTGYVDEFVNTTQCTGQDGQFFPVTYYYFGPYVDAAGTTHSAVVTTTTGQTNCYPAIQPVTGGTSLATDGSGYTLVVSNCTTAVIKSLGGVTINPYIWQGGGFSTPQGSVVDPNGNTISSSYRSSNTTTTFTDTLNVPNKPVLTVYAPGPGSTPTTFSYWNPQVNNNTPYTMKYTQQIVETNFGCSGITDYGRTTQMTQYLVSEIDLPDGTDYTFSYEATPNPNHQGAVTGRLGSVTLPTGGTITYTYTGANNGITCADGTTATLERYTPDTGSNYWTYAHTGSGTYWTTKVTDPTTPQGNVSTYDFLQVSGTQYAYESERTIDQGPSSLLATVDTCYNGASIPCTSAAIAYPLSNRTVQTTLPSTAPSKTYTTYNTYNLPTEVDEYDWGGSTASRITKTTYTSCGVTNTYVVNRPCSVTVYGTGSSPAAQATYAYDANGNLLTESHSNTGFSPGSISRTFTYNSNGTLKTATDFNSRSNVTNYSLGGYSCNSAFPNTITPPISSLAASYQYDCNGGVMTQVTDPNSKTTQFKYTDPNNFWRLVETDYPDGGIAKVVYTDTTGNFTVANSVQVTSGNYHTVTQTLDGLGRATKSVDSQTSAEVLTGYNSVGLVASVTNPYTPAGEPSDGTTYYSYDALGRPADVSPAHAITFPDGGYTSMTYSGNCATATDAAGNGRKLCSDALGRVASVTESPGGLNYSTTYTYDTLNDLAGVTQSGQTRTYNYDMLARLASAKIPEMNVSGTQCSSTYGYDANGNLISKKAPLENQNSSCTTTVTTTYAYDVVNRLISKTYNDTPQTPPAYFFYDQAPANWPAWSGVSFTNAKGRLALACTNSASGTCTSPATAVAYSYDPVGRTNEFWQCNPSNCGSSPYSMTYTYDKAGDVTSWNHPGLISFNNTVNAAQQVTAVQTTSSYTNLPQTLVQNAAYTAWGAVSQFENGCAGSSCTNAQETYQYNNRLQPAMIQLSGTSNGGYCLVYNYYADESSPTSCATPTQGVKNNGNVMGYWYQDSVNSSFSHKGTYSYDGVNRLSSAVATGNSTYNLAFTYDRYGNMACSQNSNTNGPCPEWTYNTSSNQLTTSGFTYDAAGNLTKDSSNATAHTYQWDAEGRVTSVDPGNNPPTWAFTYNALGQRVQWVSPSGTYEHMFDPSGAWLGIYGVLDVLRWGNGAYAWYNGSETYFNHINNISSTSVMTNHAGTTVEDVLFYPWGDVWESWGNGGYNFAELPYYDPTTNTSPTLNRFYSMNVGRWLSPDPVPGDPTNPQTWNRYAYALNNPTTLIDPLGLDPEDAGNGCTWDPDTNTLNCPPPPGPPTIGCANMDGYGCGYNGPNTANWGSPTYPGDGSGGSGGSGNGANNGSQSQTSACTVTNGRTTAPSPEQMNRLGAGPFGVPPVGSVAIDPWALGLLPGKQTNALLGPNASQITFSFSPVPNLPQGFPTTMTLGSIVGPASVRAGGSQFNGLYVFDIFGLPSLAAANAATSPPGAPVGVTVTYPSSLPVNCGGPLSDTPPVPPPPTAPVPAFRRHF